MTFEWWPVILPDTMLQLSAVATNLATQVRNRSGGRSQGRFKFQFSLMDYDLEAQWHEWDEWDDKERWPCAVVWRQMSPNGTVTSAGQPVVRWTLGQRQLVSSIATMWSLAQH